MRGSRWEHSRQVFRCEGAGGIIEELLARARHRWDDPRGKEPYGHFRTRDWDRRHRVETIGNVAVEDFASDLPNIAHGESYIPTTLWFFRGIVEQLLDLGVRPRESMLLDLGCGKGRAVLLAMRMGFREAVGVEFVPDLARVAEENLRSYRGRRRGTASVHCGDASAFPVPGGPIVVFLFNPFRGPVLETVAGNLARSFANDPRPFFLVYSNPRPDSPFRRGAPFRCVATRPKLEFYHLAADDDQGPSGPREA